MWRGVYLGWNWGLGCFGVLVKVLVLVSILDYISYFLFLAVGRDWLWGWFWEGRRLSADLLYDNAVLSVDLCLIPDLYRPWFDLLEFEFTLVIIDSEILFCLNFLALNLVQIYTVLAMLHRKGGLCSGCVGLSPLFVSLFLWGLQFISLFFIFENLSLDIAHQVVLKRHIWRRQLRGWN